VAADELTARPDYLDADARPPEPDIDELAARVKAGDPEALAVLAAAQAKWASTVTPKLPAASGRALVRGQGSPESKAYLVRFLRAHRHVRVHGPRPMPRFAPRAREHRATRRRATRAGPSRLDDPDEPDPDDVVDDGVVEGRAA
jgi:hypothetical protein